MTGQGMLEETGTVVDLRDGMALVETRSRSACSACGSGSCGTSVVSQLFGLKRNRLALDNALGASIGDRVVIGIPDAVLVKAALWAYLVPVALMVMATGVSDAFALGNMMQALCALLGLAGGLYLVRYITGRDSRRHEFDPVMLKIEGRATFAITIPVTDVER